MENDCTIFEVIYKWYQDVETLLVEIEEDPSKIGEVAELRIDGIDLTESDLSDIACELEGLYYGFEPPTVDEFVSGSIYCCKKIIFDRYFDETFEYEGKSLVISTGFEYEYWQKDSGDSDLYGIDEKTYEAMARNLKTRT